jgi:hypothetical protein
MGLAAPVRGPSDKPSAAVGAIHFALGIHGQIDQRMAQHAISSVATDPLPVDLDYFGGFHSSARLAIDRELARMIGMGRARDQPQPAPCVLAATRLER